ncbi:MAG: glycosyltransferase, partial [Acetobacteraceae bacterium]
TVTSASQMKAWWPDDTPEEVSVLHNGIDLAAWPYQEHGDGSAAWCGRITPNKGTHLAAEAARRAGLPLTIFGTIEDPAYWQEQVAPLLGDGIRYGGHIGSAALAGELGRASVFLFTPCWDEPFGLVAVEAMACGVPVASFDMGAAREVVAEAGAFAATNNAAALAEAIPAAMAIPRRIPLERVTRLFTRDIWLDRCEVLYRQARADAGRTGGAE